MRKLLTLAASTVALAGVSAASAATIQFTGTLGAVDTAANQPDGATNPVMGGDAFTITLDYDGDSINSAMIMIGSNTDDAEIIRADVIDVDSATANANALDSLSIDLVSTDGSLPGNFDLDFQFFNSVLGSESIGSALDALRMADDMGMLVCSHFMFNFGGFKYEGQEVVIVENPAGEIPVPGAAVLMISGLAAAGVARRRRQA